MPRERARGATWVRPELVGEVVFRNWTPDGRLRAPSWRGLRSDKDAADLEPEAAPRLSTPGPQRRTGGTRASNCWWRWKAAELTVQSGQGPLPGRGLHQGQVIDYYSRVAPVLLPHLKDRPVTLRRFPTA